jgi:uncharacterized protein (DUF58 family)
LDTAAPLLFDSAFLAKLEQLFLLSKKLFRGEHRAERRSRETGASLEFADYRNYSFGDDLRSIDWNIYGRLDRLFIKLFEQEQDLDIHFLIDASASMRWTSGADRISKFDQARRIAASLGYIALSNLDRVNVLWFSSALGDDLGLVRGKSQFHSVLDFLRRAPEPDGATDLLAVVRSFTQRLKRRGLVFVLSDFLDARGYAEPLGLLRFNRFDTHVIQVLDPAEIDPDASGDLRLVDCETGAPLEVTATPAVLASYRMEIARYLASLTAFCRRRGVAYGQASTAVPFEDLVLRVLRDGMILK